LEKTYYNKVDMYIIDMSERGPSNTHKEATDSHICCNLFLESKGGFPPSKDVRTTVVGYTKGLLENSTYKNVYTDKTEHAGQYS
jgi:hypothetical protein